MDTHILSFVLSILGSLATTTFLVMAGIVLWRYRDCPTGTFRWHVRNQHFKHLSALACLFFLAMAASYVVLLEVWAVFYFVVAVKVGTWWLRLTLIQRS